MRRITGVAAAIAVLILGIARAGAADLALTHHAYRAVVHVHHERIRLPAERHVIEVVQHAYSTRFIINGLPFAGQNACAFGWVAGQQVRLMAGSWHGACVQAVFYNVPRHQSCTLWCPAAGHG